MKSLKLIVLIFLMSVVSYAYENELKLGYEPYQSYKGKTNQGGTVGFESLMHGKQKLLRYGLGTELKTGVGSNSIAVPLYIVAKKDAGIKKSFYLIGRGGLIFSKDSSFNTGLYLAAGIGKEIKKVNLEALYEFSNINNRPLKIISLKIGYRFGTERKVEKLPIEDENKMKNEYEKTEKESEKIKKQEQENKMKALEVTRLKKEEQKRLEDEEKDKKTKELERARLKEVEQKKLEEKEQKDKIKALEAKRLEEKENKKVEALEQKRKLEELEVARVREKNQKRIEAQEQAKNMKILEARRLKEQEDKKLEELENKRKIEALEAVKVNNIEKQRKEDLKKKKDGEQAKNKAKLNWLWLLLIIPIAVIVKKSIKK